MSWKTIRRALRNKDMRKRLLWVFGMILVFRFLSHIPVPIAEPTQLRQLLSSLFEQQQLLGFLDLLSGGALSNFSIMLLGLAPYINASIIMQLLTKAVPKLEAINKEGESGRKKINQYTRMLTLPLAIVQSIGFVFLIKQSASAISGVDVISNASIAQWTLMVACLTGGAMLLMWMGELMSEQGVGNGISLLIFAGIVSQMPQIITTLLATVIGSSGSTFEVFGLFNIPLNLSGTLFVLGIVVFTFMLTYWVVKLNEANRSLTISYAKRVRGNRAYGGVNTSLPIKLITAGVIPIIFAVAFLSVPFFLGQLMINAESQTLVDLGTKLSSWFNPNGLGAQGGGLGDWTSFIYPGMYFVLVVMFTYFYTGIMFNAKEIAENLQKQGGFIAGIRPGLQTEKYLKKIVNRLTLFGALALGTLAILPFIIDAFVILIFKTPVSQTLTIGGTGLLITVSVAIETLRQIDSRALMITYDSYND